MPMKILLTNPPLFNLDSNFNRPVRFPAYNYATPVMHPPLYLSYAAAYLLTKGHEVLLIDAPVLRMGPEKFVEQVAKYNPQFVVFETSTPSFKNDVLVAEKVKERVETRVVFLGTHVSSLPEESMGNKSIDAIIMGEYELTLAEYIESGPENTRGVCYRKDEKVIVNPHRERIKNLDMLPFPARELLPNSKYFDPILENPFTYILAGRGCPYRCIFCNWPQTLTGREYRMRSPKNIVDELEHIKRNYNFKSILFNDDTLTASKENVQGICSEIKRRNINLKWGCYARADERDENLLDSMREAGCYLIKVGVESGNQMVLDNMRKGYQLDNVRNGIRLMKSKGFHVHATFAFGLPGEDISTIQETIRFAKELDPTTVQFSIAVPYPGTEFFDYLKDNNFLITNDWDNFVPTMPIYEYPNLSFEEMNSWLKKAYRTYYFRWKYIGLGTRKLFTQPKVLLASFRKLSRFVIDR